MALTAFFPFLRPLAGLVLVVDLAAEALMGVSVPFLVVEVGVLAPSVELLSDLGASAAASEIRLGRDEAAVCSMTFLLFSFIVERRPLFAGGAVASSTAFALRFGGAIAKTKTN